MTKIALDLDGVVFDSEDLYRVYTEIYDTDINKKDTVIDNSEKLFQKRYNWTMEESNSFYDKYAMEVLTNSPIKVGVDIVIDKLKDKYEFIIVTSRTDAETDIVRKKLEEIGLGSAKIFTNESYKIDRLLEEGVSYIIDDSPIVCSDAADNNITALYFKNNASTILNKDGVVNVNNWGEIYKYLTLNN